MSWLERLRLALRRETADAREWRRETEQRLDAELSRKERELDATPEERLQASLDEIAASDDAFDDVRRRLDGGGKGRE